MSDNENTEAQIVESQAVDGTYKIETTEDGVFLSVNPPKDGGIPVREPIIVQDLKARNIKDFNYGLVISTAKEASGRPVKICEKVVTVEPEIQVLVDRDRMGASLTIVIPKNSRPVTLEETLEKLHTAGVVTGIDMDAVKLAIERPNLKVVCAVGEAPVNGVDAVIVFLFDTEKKGHPEELADGRVDFKDLNLFTIVNEGDVLAEKTPATPGTVGSDVLGQPAYAKAGKDRLLPIGKNVFADGNKVIAAISGQLQIANNKLTVSPVIEIKEDVDLSTGNIDFIGNVLVRGSVQTGFTVRADGNVEIGGTVSGGTVEGKNVIIRAGIQGMQRGYIKAAEDVVTKFIENATVSAGGDIIVADTVLHSQINAGKKIIVEGKRGFIAGGHVMAAEEIRAKIVGTHMAVPTDLEVGVNPDVREEYQTLRKDLKRVEVSLDQTQKGLVILKTFNPADLPPEKRELLLKFTKAQFLLAGQLENMRKRIAEIDLIFEEARFGKIRVSDTVYPGVKIVIGTLVKPIREPLKFVSFYSEEGEIKIGSYK